MLVSALRCPAFPTLSLLRKLGTPTHVATFFRTSLSSSEKEVTGSELADPAGDFFLGTPRAEPLLNQDLQCDGVPDAGVVMVVWRRSMSTGVFDRKLRC
jgi:hypothetical protein